MISYKEVLSLYNLFKDNGIMIWIDGGWGVDALIGMKTRDHEDLDIAVHRKDSRHIYELLSKNGYTEEKRDDSTDYMYIMKNDSGIYVDVHVFEYDEFGKNIYGIEYPFGSLTGKGLINGQQVNCIDKFFMLKF